MQSRSPIWGSLGAREFHRRERETFLGPSEYLPVDRVALKIAYDGTVFQGYARQPALHTVEAEVLRSLVRAGVIRDSKEARFQSASRTDRGVSALGNVVAFDSSFPSSALPRAFNAKARGVWAWGVADVPAEFNARSARERWYRYRLQGAHDEGVLRTTLSLFLGEHDFRSFTRDRTRTVARIDVAAVVREDDIIHLEFRAPSFRWNLVRRLVAAALAVESEGASREDIESALHNRSNVDFGLAPPEPLTLVDVLYGFPFRRVSDPTTVDRIRRLLAERTASLQFAEVLLGAFRGPADESAGTQVNSADTIPNSGQSGESSGDP